MKTFFNCYVYWIHLENHTWNDGYIGVSIDPDRRFIEHAKGLKGRNKIITEQIKKYRDKIVYDIIYIGTEESCYELENLLRPNTYMGWNKATGGRRNLSNGLKGIKKSKPAWNKGISIPTKSTARYWKITNQELNLEQTIFSLREWCKNMGYNYQSIHMNFANKKPYKGYQISLLETM